MHTWVSAVPGIFTAILVASGATLGCAILPGAGAPVFGLVLGVAVRSCVRLPAALDPGLALCARRVLPASIVLSGFGLSIACVVRTGSRRFRRHW